MKQLLLVFVGGGFGSALRYFLVKFFNSQHTTLPYGTFLVNILGSLLIGIILGTAAKNQSFTQEQSLLLATGFCGGFTTFSAFAFQNYDFLKNGDYFYLTLYTILSFALAILAVFFGMFLTRLFA